MGGCKEIRINISIYFIGDTDSQGLQKRYILIIIFTQFGAPRKPMKAAH
ncbi:hypothetical protein MNV_550028 [Candidatus Methanoperedens nitroreducens]|uniref:Uncharacterized protein n=1 Tax=Candidatus Methanoperedens nitratireducens TaxID=1392998 RepID=A0A284VRV2_9EURY|nr:hypothetical protein MNV_550028 [Candidatus Methanoperedens nitroreducens]